MAKKDNQEFPISAAELKRMSIIRRYASVAYDLPNGAKDALSVKMGSIEVSPKDSFELYLSTLQGAYPSCDFVVFQKRFSEIFARKAFVVLRKIIENRSKNAEHYISNDYFGQEFKELFIVPQIAKTGFFTSLDAKLGNMGNRKVKGVLGFNRAVAKVGLSGVVIDRRFVSKKKTQEIYPVKWK